MGPPQQPYHFASHGQKMRSEAARPPILPLQPTVPDRVRYSRPPAAAPAAQRRHQVYTADFAGDADGGGQFVAPTCHESLAAPARLHAMNPHDVAAMRSKLYTAVVADVLDALGFRGQAVSVALPRQSGRGLLVGRAKTMLWETIDQIDPRPYELELKAVDECQTDDVLIAAASGQRILFRWSNIF